MASCAITIHTTRANASSRSSNRWKSIILPRRETVFALRLRARSLARSRRSAFIASHRARTGKRQFTGRGDDQVISAHRRLLDSFKQRSLRRRRRRRASVEIGARAARRMEFGARVRGLASWIRANAAVCGRARSSRASEAWTSREPTDEGLASARGRRARGGEARTASESSSGRISSNNHRIH